VIRSQETFEYRNVFKANADSVVWNSGSSFCGPNSGEYLLNRATATFPNDTLTELKFDVGNGDVLAAVRAAKTDFYNPVNPVNPV
jgi:hypothetical protein